MRAREILRAHHAAAAGGEDARTGAPREVQRVVDTRVRWHGRDAHIGERRRTRLDLRVHRSGARHGSARLSRPRVELPVHRAQRARRQMRVDLRRRDVGVAEHRLHGAQVGAALEQMARERVAQHVR